MVMISVEAALIVIPEIPAAEMPPAFGPPSIVTDFVMVTVPKPPGSSASISPNADVFEMAPAQVLHGAVRLQGLASSPTPDIHVRVACAEACCARKRKVHNNKDEASFLTAGPPGMTDGEVYSIRH